MKNVKQGDKKRNISIIIIASIVALIIIVSIFAFYFFKIESYEITGNKNYTEEEIQNIIFEKAYEKNAIGVYINNIFGKKKTIPFVETYDVDVIWPNRVKVTIYEKAITAYIEYMGVNMFFDKDGIIVESSTKLPEGIPLVCGLQFDSMQLYSKLAVKDDKVFNTILSIDVDKIQFDKNYNIILYKGDIKILLGDGSNIGERIYRLSLVMNKFEGLKGTLYLDDFDENNGDILFKKEN